MLARMWRNGNPLALSVGMQTGAATLENHMEVLQKVKNITALWSSNCTIGFYQEDTKIQIQRGTCTRMFRAALLTIAKLWREPKCPSTEEWVKKMWYIYTMEWYSAIKKNEILPFAMTWMEVDSIMLSKISHSEKDKHHMISLICGISETKHEHRGREAKIR